MATRRYMLPTCTHQAAAGSCTRLMLITLTRVIAATNAAGQGTSSERRKVLKICAWQKWVQVRRCVRRAPNTSATRNVAVARA